MFQNVTIADIAQFVSIISDLAVAATAIGALFVGVRGLNDWKRKTKFDLVRSTVHDMSKSCDEYNFARNPVTFSDEVDTNATPHAPALEAIQREYEVKLKRLEPLRVSMLKLRDASWEIGAMTDKDLADDINHLISLYQDLITSFNAYFGTQLMMVRFPKFSFATPETMLSMQTKVYGIPTDEYGIAVKSATEKLLDKLQKHFP